MILAIVLACKGLGDGFVAFDYVHGTPVVSAQINGMPVRLEVDTGAAQTYLNGARWPSPKGGDYVSDLVVDVGGQRGIVRAFVTKNATLDRMEAEKVDGFLGTDYLSNFTVGLDLAGNRLRLWPKSTTAAAAQKEWGLGAGSRNRLSAVAIHRNSPGHYACPVMVQGVSMDSILDTGAVSSAISIDGLVRLGPVRWTGLQKAYLSDGASPILQKFEPTDLALDGLQLRPPTGISPTRVNFSADLVVGEDVLKGERLIFDFNEGKLLFQQVRAVKKAAARPHVVAAHVLVEGRWIPITNGSEVWCTKEAPLPPLVVSPLYTVNAKVSTAGGADTYDSYQIVARNGTQKFDPKMVLEPLGDVIALSGRAKLSITRGTMVLFGAGGAQPMVHFLAPYKMDSKSLPDGVVVIAEQVNHGP